MRNHHNTRQHSFQNNRTILFYRTAVVVNGKLFEFRPTKRVFGYLFICCERQTYKEKHQRYSENISVAFNRF